MADYNSTHSGATIDTTITNASAGGIGRDTYTAISDLDTLTLSGFYRYDGTSINTPVSSTAGVIYHAARTATSSAQIAIDLTNQSMYFRARATSWSSWIQMHSSTSMQTTTANGIGVVKLMKNTSGGAIADAASVAGSTISSVKFDNTGALTVIAVASGTWQSVNGASLASNESGYFVRTA